MMNRKADGYIPVGAAIYWFISAVDDDQARNKYLVTAKIIEKFDLHFWLSPTACLCSEIIDGYFASITRNEGEVIARAAIALIFRSIRYCDGLPLCVQLSRNATFVPGGMTL